MKRRICLLLAFLLIVSGLSAAIIRYTDPSELKRFYDKAHKTLLPDYYPVYTRNGSIINRKARGFKRKFLFSANVFKGSPGCYVACYSHNRKGLYSVGGGIYVMGQVRVKGKYSKRVCLPHGYESKDISALQKFKSLCNAKVPKCKEKGCWAGGDTGGWFGIQSDGSVLVDTKTCPFSLKGISR